MLQNEQSLFFLIQQHSAFAGIQYISEVLLKNNHLCYLAGGAVRDFLLNLQPADLDLVTDARPDQIQNYFTKTLDVGQAFGVIKVVVQNQVIDVATFREEDAYFDGRHPEQIIWSKPDQDALRRDFTINGLFFDLHTMRLMDFVHGLEDLKSKKIRAIGNPKKRFQEDHLRLLRAVRFAAQLNFEIENKTWEHLKTESILLSDVSGERICMELIKISQAANWRKGLHLMQESGLEQAIWGMSLENRLQWLAPQTTAFASESEFWVFYFSALFLNTESLSLQIQLAEYLDRLKFSKKNRDFIIKSFVFIQNINQFLQRPLGQQLSELRDSAAFFIFKSCVQAQILDPDGSSLQLKFSPLWQHYHQIQTWEPLLKAKHVQSDVIKGPLLGECLRQAYWYQLQHKVNHLQDMLVWLDQHFDQKV